MRRVSECGQRVMNEYKKDYDNRDKQRGRDFMTELLSQK